MADRPILFSAPMVRALIAGTKTQTRRVVHVPPGVSIREVVPSLLPNRGDLWDFRPHMDNPIAVRCPYGQPSDRLWVRETWMPDAPRNGEWADTAFYGCGMSPLSDIPECYRKPWHCLHRATYEGCELVGWKPSIHMPRWASRITLEITGVRVERLQDISEGDALAEGIVRTLDGYGLPDGSHYHHSDPVLSYWSLWDSINGQGSVDANPWVWVLEFRRAA